MINNKDIIVKKQMVWHKDGCHKLSSPVITLHYDQRRTKTITYMQTHDKFREYNRAIKIRNTCVRDNDRTLA